MSAADELPIVKRLEGDVDELTVSEIWFAAGMIKALYNSLAALEPHLDAIVCYASTMGEHEPNRLVVNARSILAKARGESV